MDLLGNPILVPLDGSTLAEHALPAAERIAAVLRSELLLARVTALTLIPFEIYGGAATAEVYQQLADDDLRLANEYIERIAADLRGRGRQVKTMVRRGEPASTLLDIEAQSDVGLVVMTTHGRTGMVRFALGSTADRLVRHGHVPVLLLRPEVAGQQEEDPFARVIVPLDGSPLGESSLKVVAPLAGRLVRQVTLMRVIPATALAAVVNEANRYLNTVRERLSEQVAGQPCAIETLVVRGEADEQIIEQAETHQSMIVMATHGLTGIRRWSYGSIADHVIHGARTAVLLVHPPLAQLPPVLAEIESGGR
ncbi:MAG TPA: universal stress protein [Ktedonobacterales bacterium]|nr:universal stress protein [Ktedonobacterales bacterium]